MKQSSQRGTMQLSGKLPALTRSIGISSVAEIDCVSVALAERGIVASTMGGIPRAAARDCCSRITSDWATCSENTGLPPEFGRVPARSNEAAAFSAWPRCVDQPQMIVERFAIVGVAQRRRQGQPNRIQQGLIGEPIALALAHLLGALRGFDELSEAGLDQQAVQAQFQHELS